MRSRTQTFGARNPKVWGSIPHGDSEFFFVPRSWQDEKTSFSNLILVENMKCRETFSRPSANFRNIVG